VAAAIVDELTSLEQASCREAREQLRDRRAGDARTPHELGTGHALGRDSAHGQELRHRQRGIVTREETLDPPADQRRDRNERIRDVS
jgi:hypothetical protein